MSMVTIFDGGISRTGRPLIAMIAARLWVSFVQPASATKVRHRMMPPAIFTDSGLEYIEMTTSLAKPALTNHQNDGRGLATSADGQLIDGAFVTVAIIQSGHRAPPLVKDGAFAQADVWTTVNQMIRAGFSRQRS